MHQKKSAMRDLHFWRTGETEPDTITGAKADGRIAGAGDLLTIPHPRDQLISITQKLLNQNHHAKTTPYMPRFRGSCGQVRARAAPSPPACAARADRGAEHPLITWNAVSALLPCPYAPCAEPAPGSLAARLPSPVSAKEDGRAGSWPKGRPPPGPPRPTACRAHPAGSRTDPGTGAR